jgi:hypothetical protein
MVYDAARGETILFGGWTQASAAVEREYPNDLWAWNGERWRLLEPTSGTPRPPGRDVPVLAYDASRARVVLFGGRRPVAAGDSATWQTDVWEWDGSRWYRVRDTNIPEILHPTATYDRVRRRVVVYGGGLIGDGGRFSGFSRTLWEWDGARWSPRDTAGPVDAVPSVAVAAADGALLFLTGPAGPNRDAPNVSSRVWALGSTGWQAAGEGPAFNNLQAATGAPDGTIFVYHAWEDWIESPVTEVREPAGTWRLLKDAPNPGVRNVQAAAWDSRRHRLVLYGGHTRDRRLLNDTWEFDGQRWTRR